MYKKYTIIIIIIPIIIFSITGLSYGTDQGHSVNIQFENDFFGGDTDRHFTHGTRIEYLTKSIPWITDAADKLPWFNSEKAFINHKGVLETRASISLGQSIYTPEDTATSELILDDRPYAGWSYLGFGLVANQGNRRYDKIELEIGIVGPRSLAENIQTFWHSLFGLQVPNGWGNQLNNEPGIVLYYEQAWRFDKHITPVGLDFDIVPNFGGCLGNVFTYGSMGLTARLGLDLGKDFGPPRIRPSLPGSGYYKPRKGFNYYLFAGISGRAVLRNIFLDGNSFSQSHSVDKRSAIGDLQAGVSIYYGRFRFSYTQIYRTKEFYGQNDGDIFGSLNLSYQF